MRYNTIGSRRGSVRGPPPSVYVPFGEYDAQEHHIRAAVKFFTDWIQILIWYVVIITFMTIYVILWKE